MGNKKGFTLVELLAAIVVMALLLMIVFPNLQRLQQQNNSKKYTAYEDMMVEYARIKDDGTKNNYSLSELDELANVKNECTGYVTITRVNNLTTYKAYISCGDKYQTTGFTS